MAPACSELLWPLRARQGRWASLGAGCRRTCEMLGSNAAAGEVGHGFGLFQNGYNMLQLWDSSAAVVLWFHWFSLAGLVEFIDM